ncbi:MAG TPA: AsnC family protein, partial [Acidimicrobiia bacterium]|nr:AsnC family protein [Acidimicrobiia bacterium]
MILDLLAENARRTFGDIGERVGVAGDGENGLDLGDPVGDTGDGVDAGVAGEADLGEGFEGAAELGVVDAGGVA